MKVKSQTTVIVSILIVLIGILITSFLGLWTTQSTKIPKKLTEAQYNGVYDPSDIRGSYTFLEISTLFEIPLEDLATAFGVEEGKSQAFKCKDLETIYLDSSYEIGTGSVRLFVAFYTGLPYDLTEETYLTDMAAEILKEKSNLTEEQLSYLENHTIS